MPLNYDLSNIKYYKRLYKKTPEGKFKMDDVCIEYSLSVVVEDERVLLNYSGWDRTTKIGVYDKKYIDSMIKYKP